ncbi:SDR family NAD(P)-dependent oxidoreductase [Bacillus halotolerans]|uniref:SDR family NAD(P)-dependent oxidoreductase n=1 Tax=Bacillus TaxID=1386 RepID=UPI000D0368B6|nr:MULTISPECIES: SDR family NAD(P)-dependent oxidoreductase [Bacillus]MBV7321178.1 SDR family NAD(P)-dependent oxidoreductase [Halalkalibacterium halodurans]AZV49390.1 KR domain-containing protein [Bacillus halotolerans]MCP9301192.1 SDR family NAD(P)-dependent oxidoreductase [Bacillus halotolerans]MCV0026735.1 SDR family NAD(P)-dependent oxidoreductase [Bacillus sp. XT-2]MEC3637343.1 SDR family NAD(P)-dependent oxidoreductase [Bacillus halotolerans]
MKYTVITGASSGIGYETALAFAARGKNLIIVARRLDKLEELKSTIQNLNPDLDVIIRTSDLSVTDQAYTLYNSLKEYQIETWINNAGLGETSSVIDQNLDKVETMLRVNIESLTILSTLFVRDYADVEGTQLINVSSALGYVIAVGSVAYSASKYYVSAFTEGLAKELELKGAKMKAKVLAPAMTETEFAKYANDMKEFDYKANLPMYHTAKQMAGFMIEVYDKDEVVGVVDENYEFNLRKPIYPILVW